MSAIPYDPTRKLLSVNQACALAIVSRRTIYNWMDDGRLQYCLTASGMRRIFEDSLFQQEPGKHRDLRQIPNRDRA